MALIFQRFKSPILYQDALCKMDRHVSWLKENKVSEEVWLLEHSSVYTLGSSAKPDNIISSLDFPVVQTGRGGQITYHGPGQRVVYVMFDLARRGRDLRGFVRQLEEVIIRVLQSFDVDSFRRSGRVGLWVYDHQQKQEQKIAAIGVRVSQWITSHGFSLNVNPNLTHYDPIVPCGLQEYSVTSLAQLGLYPSMERIDDLIEDKIQEVFL